ncbi:VOC family protein [Dyella thiooxydans]|uniref:VOC family protein n=1 Tax=Dyella thiooxydans TaxID=445710 RepID=UPI000AF407C1|nr:VOC family protein [Dyella thiooxydans]
MIQRGWFFAGLMLALLFAGASAPARAESGSDYARLTAPDVPAATAFLRDTMNCDVLDAGASRALLECGPGSVVEITRGRPVNGNQPALRLRTENADATLGWLRQRHVPLVDDRTAGTLGPDGLLHIDVRTPWGQTLELVGYGRAAPIAATRPLAVD